MKKLKSIMLFIINTLRICSDPGFGPRDEKEATNGAGTFTSWDLYITADADLCRTKIISRSRFGVLVDNLSRNWGE